MKLRRQKKIYYINSATVSEKAFKVIFDELLKVDAMKEITAKLLDNKEVTIDFDKSKVIPNFLSELEQVKRENQLLKSKLAAVEQAFLNEGRV